MFKLNSHIILGCFTGILTIYLANSVLIPAYEDPKSRTYTSSLGASNLQRKQGKAFQVETVTVQKATIKKNFLGEGLISSDPTIIPIIPLAKIKTVSVKPGENVKKGQLLATLDSSLIDLKINSAELAIKNIQSEEERVKLGSTYILSEERPEQAELSYLESKKELEIAGQVFLRKQKLLKSGAISKTQFNVAESSYNKANYQHKEAKLRYERSQSGNSQSLNIAKNKVLDAKNNLLHLEELKKDYEIRATADGIIEKVLLQSGEYNQDTGKPGFILLKNIKFTAHLNQQAINSITKNLMAKVKLEAYPGEEFIGQVSHIIPIVSFNTGGPEINRPLRASGSGSPEWASSFKVEISLEANKAYKTYPGLSGVAEISEEQTRLTAPLSAIQSLSAGTGLVYLFNKDKVTLTKVRTGVVYNNKIEIIAGLQENDKIISSGHEVLKPGDNITTKAGFKAHVL